MQQMDRHRSAPGWYQRNGRLITRGRNSHAQLMSPSVGLVVPALNPDVPRLDAYLTALHSAVDPDVIRIELDDPGGHHGELAERLDADVNIVGIRRGKGLAITDGFEALETDILAFVDADGSTAAASVDRLITPTRNGSADLAVGSRRHPESTVTGRSAFRAVMSGSFATTARLASGIPLRDFQCGAKAITRSCWADLRSELHEDGFAWDLELLWLAHRRGHAIAEVPLTWEETPGSTVTPLRTGAELTRLLAKTAIARVRRRDQLHGGGIPLVDRSRCGGE